MATRRAGAIGDGRGGNRGAGSTGAATGAATGAVSGGHRRRSGGNGLAARSELGEELRGFVGGHPQGWGHDDWLQLLEHLRARGHEIHDPDAVGAMLERVRLTARLESVQGIGPRRIGTLSDRYGSVWNLRQADVDDVVRSARIPRALAERIRGAL